MPPGKEQPPGFRRPTPRALRRGTSQESQRELTNAGKMVDEGLNLLSVLAVFALLAMPPESQSVAPPSPVITGSKIPDAVPGRPLDATSPETGLLKKMDAIKPALATALKGEGQGELAALRRASATKERCEIAGRIAQTHMKEIVAIAAYLQLRSGSIEHRVLKEKMDTGIAKMGINLQDFASDPTRLESHLQRTMEGSSAYRALTTCGVFVLAFFGGKIDKGINENIDLVTPVLGHIEKGIRARDQQAIRAGEALVTMARKLLP